MNTSLWDSVFKTDPAYTKQFSRAGGFKGTAISPMYLMLRATEAFGPIGIGWGFNEIESKIAEGVWFSRVKLWYMHEGNRGEVEQWGATTMVNKRSSGDIFVDEEAAKKSVTDAVTKCLSYLGFAADVHMGMYDDNKYVAELREEKKKEKAAPATPKVDDRAAGIAAAQEIAQQKIAEMTSVGGTAPESQYTKMMESIALLKAEFESLNALGSYYAVLKTAGYEHANSIKSIPAGRKVYQTLVAEIRAVRDMTPIPGQDDSRPQGTAA